MPRIPLPEIDTMSPEQRRVHDLVVSGRRGRIVGPLLAALHNPDLADHWQKMGALLRYGTSLNARHSELAILVTARASNCPFEWYHHAQPAHEAGLPQDAMEAIRTGATPTFAEEADTVIYDYAFQLNRDRTVSEDTHRRTLQLFGVKGVVELTALIGYYTLVAMTLNAHAFELPEGEEDPFADTISTNGMIG